MNTVPLLACVEVMTPSGLLPGVREYATSDGYYGVRLDSCHQVIEYPADDVLFSDEFGGEA